MGEPDVCNEGLLTFGSDLALLHTHLPLMTRLWESRSIEMKEKRINSNCLERAIMGIVCPHETLLMYFLFFHKYIPGL